MEFVFQEAGRLDGHTNMGADVLLLELAENGQPGCRVYGWDGPWVSLGRFQSVQRDLVNPQTTNWVIRPTGGKAVLHGHDVTVSLAVPLSYLRLESRSLKSVYTKIIRPLIYALRSCGVKAALAEETRFSGKGARTADCFALNSPNDIVDEQTGIKVCGCALRLTERAVLLQASMPNGKPLVPPEEVIRNASLSTPEWTSTNFVSTLREGLIVGL